MKTKTIVLAAMLGAWAPAIGLASDPPIACNMKALTAQQRNELERIGEHIIAAITASRDLKDGYTFRVDPTLATLGEVAQWLDLWRRCCPFYEFRVDYRAADAELWLSVKGRAGVKEYIPLDSPRLASKLPK